MLKLNEFRHNHHPSGMIMLAKFIRRGFSVVQHIRSKPYILSIYRWSNFEGKF